MSAVIFKDVTQEDILVELEANGKKYASWNFKLKEWVWFSQFYNGKISYLAGKAPSGNGWVKRFEWGEYNETLSKGDK